MLKRVVSLVVVAAILSLLFAGSALAASSNGSGGDMPAFYDGQLFTINFKELPPGGEQANLVHNGSINTIYMCDQCEAESVPFTSVLDAIQGDGFNPLWQEVQITFNPGFTPHQLTSDTDILAAAASAEITLAPTTEVYRCSLGRSNRTFPDSSRWSPRLPISPVYDHGSNRRPRAPSTMATPRKCQPAPSGREAPPTRESGCYPSRDPGGADYLGWSRRRGAFPGRDRAVGCANLACPLRKRWERSSHTHPQGWSKSP